jgi:hypothetical protein
MPERIDPNKHIASLELKIKLLEESILILKKQYEENAKLISEFVPKVGKKRQRSQVI